MERSKSNNKKVTKPDPYRERIKFMRDWKRMEALVDFLKEALTLLEQYLLAEDVFRCEFYEYVSVSIYYALKEHAKAINKKLGEPLDVNEFVSQYLLELRKKHVHCAGAAHMNTYFMYDPERVCEAYVATSMAQDIREWFENIISAVKPEIPRLQELHKQFLVYYHTGKITANSL